MAIRVLVVDDSAFMRVFLTRLIGEDKGLELVGTAKNGLEAVELVAKLHPQVVTMDIEMPVMDGLDALKKIMKECPTPVIMLSSLTASGAEATLKALRYGAIDFLAKPATSPSIKIFDLKEELVSKIKAAAGTAIHKLSQITEAVRTAPLAMPKGTVRSLSHTVEGILAIGTSTGGPRALDTLLPALPQDFPYPIVIVQHMPATFTRPLAGRLNSNCQIQVVEAAHEQLLKPGTAYIAPGGHHMEVFKSFGEYKIVISDGEPRSGHRPSVDVLFESVAKLKNIKTHYVIMTGMGSDGAKGMLAGKKAGAIITIAESSSTCVVYGMPKSAVELGCVDHIVPLQNIAKKILEVTKAKA
jgi:two-component system, chemotaxis family, protein-glutamate methylesterase/glutaminase